MALGVAKPPFLSPWKFDSEYISHIHGELILKYTILSSVSIHGTVAPCPTTLEVGPCRCLLILSLDKK